VEIASAAILGGVVFATTTSDQFCDSLLAKLIAHNPAASTPRQPFLDDPRR
jgi:hypothetical protein